MAAKWPKSIPYLWPKRLTTLPFGAVHTYIPHIREYPPPGSNVVYRGWANRFRRRLSAGQWLERWITLLFVCRLWMARLMRTYWTENLVFFSFSKSIILEVFVTLAKIAVFPILWRLEKPCKKKKRIKLDYAKKNFSTTSYRHLIESCSKPNIRIIAIQGTKTILLFNKSTPTILIMLRNEPFPVVWFEIETLSKFPEFNS